MVGQRWHGCLGEDEVQAMAGFLSGGHGRMDVGSSVGGGVSYCKRRSELGWCSTVALWLWMNISGVVVRW